MGKKFHLFPGGNTSKGFVNYFDNIIAPWEENNRVYVLKGGPGVGKNTFMNLFGKTAEEYGFDVEYFHCASDADSLDAVRAKNLGITMLDGTAPHIIDPKIPGAIDGIINLGIYLNEPKLADNSKEIRELFEKNSFCYKLTYNYLKSAGNFQNNIDLIFKKAIKYNEMLSYIQSMFKDKNRVNSKSQSVCRKLFAAAITPQGYVNYIDTVINTDTVIKLLGPSIIVDEFIKVVKMFLEFNGYNYQLFNSPLVPDKSEYIIIDELNISIIALDDYTDAIEAQQTINLYDFIDNQMVNDFQSVINFNEKQTDIFINSGIESLQTSKWIHDDLEEIYKKCMDFDSLNVFCNQFIDNLF